LRKITNRGCQERKTKKERICNIPLQLSFAIYLWDDPPKWFFRTLSVCVFAVRFGVCCARQWRLKRVRFNALWL
jgi:hypothetical protein